MAKAAVLERVDRAVSDDWALVRMVALVRCLIALCALVVFYVDPVKPERLLGPAYASLAAYCLYSVVLAASLFHQRALVPARAQHWLDIAFYLCFAALAPGTQGEIFYLFLFAILAASFSRGFGEGLAATLVSVVSFGAVVALDVTGAQASGAERSLVGPIYLLLLGYMIAWWGGHESLLRRRLQLLKELGVLANPRLGVEHALRQHLRRLVAFFEADGCVLVYPQAGSNDYLMERLDQQGFHPPQVLADRPGQALLALPQGDSFTWSARRRKGLGPVEEQCQGLANLLETCCFVTVPYGQYRNAVGRLYLVARRRAFSETDADFLRQAAVQIASSIENLSLLEEVMSNAAQLERSRISRDIHDTTIQPYIGLKLGLEALHRKLAPGSMAAAQVEELLAMSTLALTDLRGYVARLRGSKRGWAGDHLLWALRQQAARYRAFYGIDIEVRGDTAVQLTDRVADEAYQIVCEALSNIYRHTGAKRAFVELRCDGESLTLAAGNERDSEAPSVPFVPRSIAERTASLGGRTEVRIDENGHDIVRVTIPL